MKLATRSVSGRNVRAVRRGAPRGENPAPAAPLVFGDSVAYDSLQAGLEDKIDVAALVTGDRDFVPLVRALQKAGVATTAVSLTFEGKVNKGYITRGSSRRPTTPWT